MVKKRYFLAIKTANFPLSSIFEIPYEDMELKKSVGRVLNTALAYGFYYITKPHGYSKRNTFNFINPDKIYYHEEEQCMKIKIKNDQMWVEDSIDESDNIIFTSPQLFNKFEAYISNYNIIAL